MGCGKAYRVPAVLPRPLTKRRSVFRAPNAPKILLNETVISGWRRCSSLRFFVEASIDNPTPPRYLQREAARRSADTLFAGRQQRAAQAKQEAASQSAANAAKTIRLR